MTPIHARMSWLPAAAVGVAAAAGGEMAIGLLLYARGGFLGALTLILCVETLALALGLWSAPRDTAPPWPGMRRAWLLLVLAYVGAALVAGSWEALDGLAGTWVTRGLGLALLAALPLYATGVVLGAPALGDGDPPAPSGLPALLGAALGFGLVGFGRSGLRIAAFSYVASVVVVAAGALVHGRLLTAREQRWREWAERGAARDDPELTPARPPVPRPPAMAAPPRPPRPLE